MAEPRRDTLSPDAFLDWERGQNGRHHYVRGEVFAMSGGSPRHSFLGAQAIRLLGQQLAGGPCQMHSADLRLGVAVDQFVYADAVIVCPPIELRPGTKDVVTNPEVVLEVLSKSTEAYDRGDKLASYLALGSVQHVVFVSQRARRVESYSRQDDGSFRFEIQEGGGSLQLVATKLCLVLDELYENAFQLPGDD